MGDSILNFDDLAYGGLSDTATGFTGSSTLQDVQAGAPIPLDTSLGPTDTATPDFMNLDYSSGSTWSALESQKLAGTSDTPPSAASAALSTPTPNVAPMNANSAGGLSMLSKMGASFASLFAGSPQTHVAAPGAVVTPAGGALPSGAVSGTNTLILLIVVGALIFLLLREEH